MTMLSIADAIVAISHIWGVTQHVEKFLDVYYPNGTEIQSTDIQCTAQAALAVFGTMASFLWTLVLAFYIFIVNCIPGGKIHYNYINSYSLIIRL